MQPKKLIWHIFPANILVTIGALAALTWYGSAALQEHYITWLSEDLEARALLIEDQVTNLVKENKHENLKSFCRRAGRKSSTRITIIMPSGKVIADSDQAPLKMGDHSNRPEIITAMAGHKGEAIRFSATLGTNMLYVAMPLPGLATKKDNGSNPVIRMSVSVTTIDQALFDLRIKVLVSSVIVALIAAFLTITVSRRISKPLEEMKDSAEQFANENFSRPLILGDNVSSEVNGLAVAMNTMADKLQERFSTIVQQRNQAKTILDSMVEAVLVVDKDKTVTAMNAAAAALFEIPVDKAIGRPMQAIVRNYNLEQLIGKSFTSKNAVIEGVTIFSGGQERFLQCYGARLSGYTDKCFGAVLALLDLTDMKRLENARRDFVANASHELMTPLTSIKGYAETILDGDMQDIAQTQQFLEIIVKQSDRLQAIVTDMLVLSKIEQETETNEIFSSPTFLKDILVAAVQTCGVRAKEKDISLELECQDDYELIVDATMIEQAVINLVINAIKYSAEESRVQVKAEVLPGEGGDKIAIIVRDFGVGIGKKHLPRLFERFYRSDKARSRKLGGTGLGLAIVKHIAQAHNGSVEVESELGQGSTFTILLPCDSPIKDHA